MFSYSIHSIFIQYYAHNSFWEKTENLEETQTQGETQAKLTESTKSKWSSTPNWRPWSYGAAPLPATAPEVNSTSLFLIKHITILGSNFSRACCNNDRGSTVHIFRSHLQQMKEHGIVGQKLTPPYSELVVNDACGVSNKLSETLGLSLRQALRFQWHDWWVPRKEKLNSFLIMYPTDLI